MDMIAGVVTGLALSAAGSTVGLIEASDEALKLANESLHLAAELGLLIKEAAE